MTPLAVIFDLLPCYKSVQEVAKDLAPKIQTLQANLEIIKQFHEMEDLHSIALTQHLAQNIMRSFPWKYDHSSMINSWNSTERILLISEPLPHSNSSPSTSPPDLCQISSRTPLPLRPLYCQGIRIQPLCPQQQVQSGQVKFT